MNDADNQHAFKMANYHTLIMALNHLSHYYVWSSVLLQNASCRSGVGKLRPTGWIRLATMLHPAHESLPE